MSTGPTASLRVEKIAAGADVNTWGEPHLNTNFDMFDDAIAGISTIALTANHTLTSVNFLADEARRAILKFTGAGAFVITAPSVSKTYAIWNNCTGNLTITCGAGATATLVPGEIVNVICDGVNVKRVQPTDFGAVKITSLADPTNPQDAATRAYVDAQAWAGMSGTLPGQLGNGGKALTTDGNTPTWQAFWGPTALHLSIISDTTREIIRLATSADVVVGGMAADTAGNVGFVNNVAAWRFAIDLNGVGSLTSDAGDVYTVATKTTKITAMGALDIDCSLATELFTKAISANQVFTFSNPTASRFQGFILKLTITSAALPTWPATVKWPGGAAPTLGNGVHLLAFLWDGAATLWYGVTLSVAAA